MKKVAKGYVFETRDGKAFDDQKKAAEHEARLDLADFFGDKELGDVDGPGMAQHIFDNLDRFAEIIRPLIRKPRTAKAEATADEYEAAIGEVRSELSAAIDEDRAAAKGKKG